MQQRYVKFIYNPHSGENKILSKLDYIVEQYQYHGFTIVPYRLSHDSDFDIAFADVTTNDYNHILIAGGDGSVNSVVNYMRHKDIDLPIAVLPAGTANDFAKLLGCSSSLNKACREILSGEVQSVDLGRVNDMYFVNVLSAGLFTEVSQKTPIKLKNTFGRMAYYVSSLQELPMFRKIHLNIKSKDFNYDDDSLILFVFNGRTAGNMNLAYRSEITDGMLDLLLIKGDNIANTLTTVFHFMLGSENDYPRGVVHVKTSRLTIGSSDESLSVDIDGESGPTVPLDIECLPGALKVIMPK